MSHINVDQKPISVLLNLWPLNRDNFNISMHAGQLNSSHRQLLSWDLHETKKKIITQSCKWERAQALFPQVRKVPFPSGLITMTMRQAEEIIFRDEGRIRHSSTFTWSAKVTSARASASVVPTQRSSWHSSIYVHDGGAEFYYIFNLRAIQSAKYLGMNLGLQNSTKDSMITIFPRTRIPLAGVRLHY